MSESFHGQYSSTHNSHVPLEAVINTDELHRRGSRPADYEAENRALASLIQEMARSSGDILQKLVETALDLCKAHSTGISILKEEKGRQVFQWFAVAGQWSRFCGSTMPRESSPSGTVLERNCTLLISHPERHYSIPPKLTPPIVEVLLVPFHAAGKPSGTLWVIAHDEHRRFDEEDARLTTRLSQLAATAYHLLAARESEQRLASIIIFSEDAIVSKSLEGIVQTWNPAAERLFGYTAEEAVGRHVSFLIPPDRADEEDRIIARIKAGKRIDPYDTVRLRSNGQPVHISLTVSPIMDETGQVVGASKIARDITERKRIEQERWENERRFRLLIEQIKDYAIFMIDPQGRATSWNEGVKRVLGFEEAEFLGKNIGPLIFTPQDVRNGVPQWELEQAAATGSANDDRWMMRKDGTQFFAFGITTSLHDDGNLLGFIKVMRDQTKQKQLENDLRRIAAKLSEADRRKTEFLATLGHELRNPLAPIRIGLEAMKMLQDDPAAIEEICSTMERQAQQMSRLIDDLMDVSRITRGKLELRKCQVALADVVQSAVEATCPFLEEANHELILTLPQQPILLDADPNRLAQVFSNLLNNASKYTPEGGHIELAAERQGNAVLVTVKDNGIGISADRQEHIFEMFTQIDRPSEKDYQGLGIGLTLVKRLVEMHGGKIEVYSEGLDKGSEFRVRLPIQAKSPLAPAPSSKTEAAPKPTQLRVLVVEDNKGAAEILGKVVQVLGNDVRTAYDGLQGIAVAAEFRPDIVLMDLGMPKMNGYEAARHIREQEWGKDMILVALTGWSQEEDKQQTEEAGFDHHLVKPAEPSELQRLFAKLNKNRP